MLCLLGYNALRTTVICRTMTAMKSPFGINIQPWKNSVCLLQGASSTKTNALTSPPKAKTAKSPNPSAAKSPQADAAKSPAKAKAASNTGKSGRKARGGANAKRMVAEIDAQDTG